MKRSILGTLYGIVTTIVVFLIPILVILTEVSAPNWLLITVTLLGLGFTAALAENESLDTRIGFMLVISITGIIGAIVCGVNSIGVNGYLLLGIAFIQLAIFTVYMLPKNDKGGKTL